MKIMVSACLLGINCKYDGGNNADALVLSLVPGNEIIPVCPERMGGLPTPRVPSEIVGDAVRTRDGRDVTEAFRRGAQQCLELARREKPDLIILQPRSPSCGVSQRYDGTFSGQLTQGSGVTAALLMENGFAVTDAGHLRAYLTAHGLKRDGLSPETVQKAIAFRDERNWKQFHNPKDLAISLSLEAAELLEVFQWSGSDTGADGKMDKIREELADVLNYCILMADVCGLDLDDIVLEKLERNARKYPVELAYGNKAKYTELKREARKKKGKDQ